ncbi:MAG: hypothetical protein MAG715_00133 [Methanonatronarchaeales archaeon]|nr:hypothetical protein [Methanonatronarchaeales archaeon]
MGLLPEGDEREEYMRGIKKTLLSTLLGILSGALSFELTWSQEADGLIREPFALMLILFAIWLQGPLFPYIGVDPSEFDSKDWLFLGFMTVTFAITTWTLLIPVNPIYR